MTSGFDLTSFGKAPVRPQAPMQQQPQTPPPQPSAPPQPQTVTLPPDAPQSVQEALTKPVGVTIMDEEGNEFSDKLKKKAPGLSKQLWQVDKFASPVRPVQVINKDGVKVWVDANGNNVLDPNTGEVVFTPPNATPDDRTEINYHDSGESEPKI